ncbi:protein of unknown function [Methylorubrum extorquens DM4]|uniref:Uncharacterized protein n=1 Tax=Methylorubrum extorquens (strain DSM 6343 / CIP 106787 / DM4) TaxID=661410 RepID=C7CEA7_METED|nr:protein of unknown function [Methylorubrum extorquens DM4]
MQSRGCPPRIGYLAEVALLLLDPRDRDALSGLVREARSQSSGAARTTISAVAWPRSRPYPRGFDEIDDRWEVSPGLDIGRFHSETTHPAVPRFR